MRAVNYKTPENRRWSSTAAMRKRQRVNPKGHILSRIRTCAKDRGRECTITEDDFELPSHCPYLGIPLSFGIGNRHPGSYSMDRIDNAKGYVPGNVEIISDLANKMKQNATQEQLVAFAKEVLRRYEVSNLR